MEEIDIPHFPDTSIVVGLFRDVQNAAFLRQQLLQGNTDFEYAFLDASVVLSKRQVLAACFRSINDMRNDRLKSRNVHSEIVFSLSPNNNIAESFRRFGISDTTKHVVAVKVGSTLRAVNEHLAQNIHGTAEALSDENLADIRDDARIRKIYRIEAPKTGEARPVDWRAEAFVLGSMALKGS